MTIHFLIELKITHILRLYVVIDHSNQLWGSA